MNQLKKKDPAAFKRQFSVWDKTLTENKVKTCKKLYKKVHSTIIANPERVKKPGNKTPKRKTVTDGFARVISDSEGRKWLRHFRMNARKRKDRATKKLAEAMQATKSA